MPFSILCFGATSEIVGQSTLVLEKNLATVKDLRQALYHAYPALLDLRSLMVAVNGEYAEENTPITFSDEIALIPPVSGG